jgi:O-antigen chain-terminating methyltransferase
MTRSPRQAALLRSALRAAAESSPVEAEEPAARWERGGARRGPDAPVADEQVPELDAHWEARFWRHHFAAQTSSRVGNEPAPHSHWGLLAGMARLIERGVLFLSKPITGQQRAFNESLLEALRLLVERDRQLASRLQVVLTRLAGDVVSENGLGDRLARLEHDQGLDAGVMPERLEAFYEAFERRFRGEEHEIRERLGEHIAIIRDADASRLGPILDLGSGRGEWLDLLAESGFSVQGIEANGRFAATARARGQNVVHGDALEHLRSLPTGSLGGVTAIHVVEHLPFRSLLGVVTQAHRVLGSGGVLLAETPNPESVAVATRTFALDPTHRSPLPPLLLQFLFEQTGFERVEIRRLTEGRDPDPVPIPAGAPDAVAQLACRINERFVAATDYLVVGYRA